MISHDTLSTRKTQRDNFVPRRRHRGARPFFRFSHGDFNANFLNRFHLGGEWNNLVPFKPLHFDLDHPILLAYYVYIRVFSDPERIFSDLKAPPHFLAPHFRSRNLTGLPLPFPSTPSFISISKIKYQLHRVRRSQLHHHPSTTATMPRPNRGRTSAHQLKYGICLANDVLKKLAEGEQVEVVGHSPIPKA